MQPFLVIRHSAANAFADMRAIYTWRVWLFGWLGRMLAQVTFFTLLGRSAGGGDERIAYLVIGNSVMTCALECMSVVASTTWERISGTLVLLAAAPAKPVWVFFGRSVQWPISGSGTSIVALFGLAPLFGVTWRPAQVPVLILLVVLTALTTYCFGLFLAALVLNANGIRNMVSQTAYLLMMIVCGVNVPVGEWPAPVRVVADVIPLTHSLRAIRLVAADAAPGPVALAAGQAVLWGALWLTAAYFAFDAFMNRGRRAGGTDIF
ncbi:ABC transporter permease [Streptomyces corynorhini]|uniref:ABC transporter permease n=1 Tax=Streptomyces corynorhini TaxID=2282652 RepID=A0A370AX42_9ACTN|nr:ABC transporter permease [Streptomyces corynorhini]RDG32046.1 ABC transporter permease [Streptomyces corynorhini]